MSERPAQPQDEGRHPSGEHGRGHPHPPDPIVFGDEHEHARVVPPPLAPDDPGPEIRERLEPPLRGVYLRDEKGHARLQRAENPSPDGSFGYVERFVEVGGEGGHFSPGTLVLGIDSQECGCVAPETLRIFRWDEKEGAWEAIARSRPGQTRDYVWARIARPGLYGLIGVSRDPLVARTLAILRLLRGGSLGGDPRVGERLAGRICELLVCSAEIRKALEDPEFSRVFVEQNLRLGLPGLWLPEDAASVRSPRNPCGTCRALARSDAVSMSGLERPPEMAMIALSTSSETIVGRWDVLPPVASPADVVLAVHAALLRTGKVLYFGGSENRKAQNLGAPPGIDNTRLWDSVTGAIDTLPSPANHDLFCCGHALLADGRLLAAGGTRSWGFGTHPVHGTAWEGMRDATVFDPACPAGTNPWTAMWPLNPERGRTLGGGAWYPTLVTLAGGRVLSVAGYPEFADTRLNNKTLEVFDPATRAWTDQGPGADLPIMLSKLPLYPRLHLLPDGRVLCATPLEGPPGGPADVSWIWDPATKAWTSVPSAPGAEYAGLDSSSVLLPLRPEEQYRARVLLTNAPQPKAMDLSAGTPSWQPTAPRALSDPILGPPPRYHATSVLLADGTVLVQGGHSDPMNWSPPVLAAETFDPQTDTWSIAATAAVARVYHSVALLLPDGRVWTAGSDYGKGSHEGRMELYSPPYLFQGPRPTIAAAPTVVTLPERFDVETPDAAGIARVALIRCGTATHAFDGDQRWVGLSIERRTATRLTVASPPSPGVAPPGYYLLFLLTGSGVPSIGRFVRIQSSDDPAISLLRPTSGPATGGTAVEISGINLQAGASVAMGGSAAATVAFADETRLTAAAPPLPAGTLNDVVVSNPALPSGALVKGWLADFLDVPAPHPFHDFVESLVRAGITAGCGGGNFCPGDPVSRAQMAVFLLKAMHGPGWAPPAATGAVFGDVPALSFAAAWVEGLAAEGITAGCGGGNFCPNDPVTRGQMAVFLLTAVNGPGFTPPPPAGLFADVSPASPLTPWIERLAADKLTAGCGGGNFCPDDPVTRGQMAVFLARAFHLP